MGALVHENTMQLEKHSNNVKIYILKRLVVHLQKLVMSVLLLPLIFYH